jgi:Protein of unknown function (DUF4232)
VTARFLAAILAVAATPVAGPALPAGAASRASVPAPPPVASPPPCTAGDLAPSFVSARSTTSTRRLVLVLANVGTRACGMIGYVGVTLLGSDGRPLVTDPERAASGETATEVFVPASGRASVLLSWDATDVTGGCVAPSAVAVSPPNDPATLVDAWPAPTLVCRFGRIDVTPVRPGASLWQRRV